MKSSHVIRIANVTKYFQAGDDLFKALDNVSVDIAAGDFVAIVGPSGSGKSTLMNIIGLLDLPSEGRVEINGVSAQTLDDEALSRLRSESIGFVFQQFNLLPRTSASENIGLPMVYSNFGYDQTRILKLLQAVALEDRADHTPAKLSGGQQQRVAIARALINNPLIVLADEPTGNLDSQSEKDILDILVNLNRTGVTVIVVTHEQEVTQVAKRVIRMRDGRIISDERQQQRFLQGMKSGDVADIAHLQTIESSDQAAETRRARAFRKLNSYIREAFRAITSNKVRSLLSVLGITIGVAAVIAMLGLGEGARRTMQKELAGLGSNLLVVWPGNMYPGSAGQGPPVRLFMDDVGAIKSDIAHIENIAPRVSGKSALQFSERSWSSNVIGTTPGYATLRAAQPDVGRFFTDEENISRSRVAVIGRTVARNLFGDQDPIGSEIKLNRVYFQVVGILPSKGSNGWQDQDDVVLIPIQTAMKRVFGNDFVNMIDVQVSKTEMMPTVEREIKDLIIRRKKISPENRDEAITVRNMSDLQAAISSTNTIMSMLLSIIASISLLVGGIGVMNIMLVSVTERTREIGLRKALGATGSDIKRQFLIEAASLAIIGGAMGVTLGWVVAKVAAAFTSWPFEVSVPVVLVVTGITTMIGVVFGFWPASKASKLLPIAALKYE